MKLRDSFLLTFFVQGIVLSAGFLNGIIIARTIGKIGRGEYALIYFMVSVFLVILGEGFYRSNIYLTSRDKSENNINRLSSNILFYNVLIIIIIILFSLLPHKIYSIVMPGIRPPYIYLGLITAMFYIFIRQFQGIFLGLQNYWYYNLFNSMPIVLFFLLNLTIWQITGRLTTMLVLINFMTGMTLTFFVALLCFHKTYKIVFNFSWDNFKQNFSTGWRATFAYLLIFLLIRSNVYIVNYWQGLAETGLFGVAMGIAYLLQQVPNVVGVVLFPRVAEKETRKKLNLTIKVAGITFVVILIPAIILYLFGQELIVYFYKEEFSESFKPLVWLLPGIILFSITGIFNPLIWGRGFPLVSIYGPLIPLIINIILCFILIPINGIVGAAQSAAISFFIYSLIIFSYVFLKRKDLNTG